VRYTAGETEGRGNLEVRYQDLTIHSFVGRLDKDRVWGSFSGEVKLEAKLYDVTADELRINLDTEAFSARRAAAAVDPEYFQGQVEAPIYVHATEVVGRPNRVVADEGTGTSCDRWPDPHWALRSSHITVVPDNRVTFHRPELYLFGNRLFRYPWDLTLSLRQRDNRFLPEVGQNSV
jgi:lipopolysaccharide assembly outer membrane protein LptD (OstA)